MVLAAGTANAAGISLASIAPACKCEVLRERLTPTDIAEFETLPAQVRATLAALESGSAPGNEAADAIAAKLAGGAFDGAFDRVRPGTRACTVYWYGFLDNRSERVGRHRCRVTVKNGAIGIAKITGDGFNADLLPYIAGAEAVVGRTFLPGQRLKTYDKAVPANAENDNFGNKVGLAFVDKGHLYLISINERGFTEADDTFFEVLFIE